MIVLRTILLLKMQTVPELHKKMRVEDKFSGQTWSPALDRNHLYNTYVMRPFRSRPGVIKHPYKRSRGHKVSKVQQTYNSKNCSQQGNYLAFSLGIEVNIYKRIREFRRRIQGIRSCNCHITRCSSQEDNCVIDISGIVDYPCYRRGEYKTSIQGQQSCNCKIIYSCSEEENCLLISAGKSRLYHAVKNNCPEAVEALLKLGVSPNCCDVFHRTPLHLAANYGYVDMVRVLLRFKADPNAKDSIGNTPLHLAAVTNNDAVISLLMEAGTDRRNTNSIGQTMMELAIAKLQIIQRSRDAKAELLEQVSQTIHMMKDRLNREDTVNPDILNQVFSEMSVSDSTDEDIQSLLKKLSIS